MNEYDPKHPFKYTTPPSPEHETSAFPIGKAEEPASSSKKQLMFKVTRPDVSGGFVIYPDADAFADAELTDSEEGDTLGIECIKMSLDELHALPEFMGW